MRVIHCWVRGLFWVGDGLGLQPLGGLQAVARLRVMVWFGWGGPI